MREDYYIRLFEKFLQKKISVGEAEVLIQWLKGNDSFQDWMDEKWVEVPADIPLELQQKMLGHIKEEMEFRTGTPQFAAGKKRFRKFVLHAVRIAAVIILVLVTALSVYLFTHGDEESGDMIVSVERGQKAKIVLPDGTKVAVNSDSRLSYGSRFNRHERVISLEGEAYFEVAPDEERPFIVETPELAVQALGTIFNVKSYQEEKEVSTVLMSGKVAVSSGEERLVLNPNERIVWDRQTGNMTKNSVENAYDYVNWKDNTITFNGETFENIAFTLQRYYNTRIVFESESLKKHRFRGSPANTSLESILQILSLTSPLTYEVRDTVIILREDVKQKAWYEKALK